MFSFEPIATFQSPFGSKFGVPRQAGVVEDIEGRIVFEPKYRAEQALRGIENYDFLWLLWVFSANRHAPTSPMVRPPRLGGNTHLGVFATRSPYRPNPIGLSSVRLKRVDYDTPSGPVIIVSGADIMNGTPIIDIKPYIPFTDAHPEARGGFTDTTPWQPLDVVVPEPLRPLVSNELTEVLRQDPRPHYHNDPQRIYGMTFSGHDVHFRVNDGVLTIVDITPIKQ